MASENESQCKTCLLGNDPNKCVNKRCREWIEWICSIWEVLRTGER